MKNFTRTSMLVGLLIGGSFPLTHAESQEGSGKDSAARMLISGLKLHALREDADTPDLNVYGSYEEAQKLEAEIVQMYREIRAAELSLIQRQTLERSLESTLTPLSKRAKVDEALLTGTARDAEKVKEYQKELGVVIQETDAIVANAKDLLASFIVEPTQPPPPDQPPPPPPEELTPEEIAAMATQPPPPEQSETQSEVSQQQQQQQIQQLQQQQAEMQKQIDQQLAEADINLEDALEEIDAAKELVKEKLEETETAIEEKKQELQETEKPEPQKEQELAEVEKKQQELQELDKKIDTAKEVVEKVVEKLKQVAEVPEEQVEKAEEVVKDLREALAAVMEADTAVAQVPEQQATKEHTEEAVEKVEAAQTAMTAAAEAMVEMQKMEAMLAQLEGGLELSGDLAIAQMQTLGLRANARTGKWIDLTDQMRGLNLKGQAVEVPPDQRPALWENFEALRKAPTARKVIPSSTKGGKWIFIGDWYVLSRYDNTHRANLQKVYPPESILDINAQYVSEDGEPMEWEYESFLPPTIIPYGWESWKIYYFYTELKFDVDTEVWLAIGSDDRSDVWINDLPIWHSSNEHKSWTPSEGFRKVFFKKGRNKVLVRLENGQQGMGFSMFMNLSP